MSSHYIYVSCRQCKTTESIYTGQTVLDKFDDEEVNRDD